MMFSALNASGYKHNEVFYITEFEDILKKIFVCYNLMMSDNESLPNDENKIRDVLYLKYLNDNKTREKTNLINYFFDREIPEDKTQGRTDIRVLTLNSFQDTNAYYIIECKRINNQNLLGDTGLNAEYIKEGITRFVILKYSSSYLINGMIGFVVEDMNIETNIDNINNLLKNKYPNCNTIQYISRTYFIDDFDYQYCSIHEDINKNKFKLDHLMLDFSKNIKR